MPQHAESSRHKTCCADFCHMLARTTIAFFLGMAAGLAGLSPGALGASRAGTSQKVPVPTLRTKFRGPGGVHRVTLTYDRRGRPVISAEHRGLRYSGPLGGNAQGVVHVAGDLEISPLPPARILPAGVQLGGDMLYLRELELGKLRSETGAFVDRPVGLQFHSGLDSRMQAEPHRYQLLQLLTGGEGWQAFLVDGIDNSIDVGDFIETSPFMTEGERQYFLRAPIDSGFVGVPGGGAILSARTQRIEFWRVLKPGESVDDAFSATLSVAATPTRKPVQTAAPLVRMTLPGESRPSFEIGQDAKGTWGRGRLGTMRFQNRMGRDSGMLMRDEVAIMSPSVDADTTLPLTLFVLNWAMEVGVVPVAHPKTMKPGLHPFGFEVRDREIATYVFPGRRDMAAAVIETYRGRDMRHLGDALKWSHQLSDDDRKALAGAPQRLFLDAPSWVVAERGVGVFQHAETRFFSVVRGLWREQPRGLGPLALEFFADAPSEIQTTNTEPAAR
jgi:hypothetical protein